MKLIITLHRRKGDLYKMKKLKDCKTYSVILNEQDLAICKRQMLKIDIRNIDVVSNTSKMLRYLVRLGIKAPDLILDPEIKDELRGE